MPLIRINKHAWFRQNLDAFVDGELDSAGMTRVERHLAACDACAADVATARTLTSSLGALPMRSAPRSFQLTPEMVRGSAPSALPAASRTPASLTFVRVAAGIAVVAFISVFAGSLLNGSNEHSTASQDAFNSAAERQQQPVAATDGGTGAVGGSSTVTDTSSLYATSPTPLLAPATSGAVSGAGVPSATPQPPSTGIGQTPGPVTNDSGGVVTKSTNDAADQAIGDAATLETARAARSGEDDSFPWVFVFGCLAGAAVGVLVVAETRRRRLR